MVSIKKAADYIKDLYVVIAVSDVYIYDITEQLKGANIRNYKTLNEVIAEKNYEKRSKEIEYSEVYNKAVKWIENNTVEGQGIKNNSEINKPYPEVTGYYVPTLLKWEYKDLAVQ